MKNRIIFFLLLFAGNLFAAQPTVTIGALGGSPVTTSGQLTGCIGAANSINNTNYKYFEGIPTYYAGNPTGSVITSQPVTGGTQHKISIEFMLDGSSFELKFAHKAGYYRLSYDDGSGMQYVGSSTPVQPYSSAGTNAIFYINVDFAGVAQPRRYYLECSAGNGFIGVYSKIIDNVYKSNLPSGPLVFIMGDSWVASSVDHTTPQLFDGLSEKVGQLIGWRNVVSSGAGGTGFLSDGGGSSGKVTYRSRLAVDILAYSPDILIVGSCYNDPTFSQAAEQVEVQAFIDQCKASKPNMKLIIIGSWSSNDGARSTRLAVTAGVQAACTASNVLFIDPITTNPWISGTGNTSSLTGVGNSDRYLTSNIHPSIDGDTYVARKICEALEVFRRSGTF